MRTHWLGLWIAGCGSTGTDSAEGPTPEAPPITCMPEANTAERSCLLDPDAVPELLSQTGCFDDLATRTASGGLVPYDVRAPLWTDGAHKTRWIGLPAGEMAVAAADGSLDLPVGTVLLKQFDWPDDDGVLHPIETRAMVRGALDWSFHAWVWDETGSDAIRVPEGAVVELGSMGGPAWDVPDAEACTFCHGDDLRVLGPTVSQLDRQVCHGQAVHDQLATWIDDGLIASFPQTAPIADPTDPSASTASRARAWLHGNCAHCHRPGGWTPPAMNLDLRYTTTLDDTRTCGVPIQYFGGFDVPELRIAPGDPDASNLVVRIEGGGLGKMPAFGARVDPSGDNLIRRWIAELDGCPE